MNVTTPNVDTIICGDCLEEMKKLPDISRNSRREQAKIFCVEEILPDALDEIERLRASLIDLHAEYINTLEKNPGCSAWDLDEQSDADQRRLRRNAAHAISIVEPPIYLQADQQAARIKELEDDLVEELARGDYFDESQECEGYWWDRKNTTDCTQNDYRRNARLKLQAKGKIGPDASKSHLRPYEVVAADLAGRLAENRRKSWQITEDRVTAIDQGLRFLEWSNAKTGHVETKKHIAILKTMLEEASDEHGFER